MYFTILESSSVVTKDVMKEFSKSLLKSKRKFMDQKLSSSMVRLEHVILLY
jgi:hypothetical protein